ncbi:hypothetical protein QUF58_06795 [Anaerolineales bacterium HSG24]|nr:hypothetical protein [Anaerolineales bacterium HSG24]
MDDIFKVAGMVQNLGVGNYANFYIADSNTEQDERQSMVKRDDEAESLDMRSKTVMHSRSRTIIFKPADIGV